ncbi:AAA domain-containing protein [Nocardia sp. NPDC023988]|uniref:AAA domain-containing protein n=1 Tax=unclassified Nocardia TaxID=2637762 RepID=UPI0033D7DF60
MIDSRRMAVLLRQGHGRYVDRTNDIEVFEPGRTHVTVKFRGTSTRFEYRHDRVAVLTTATSTTLDEHTKLLINGELRPSARYALRFSGFGETWWHVFEDTESAGAVFPGHVVEVVRDHADQVRASAILGYWRSVAEHLSEAGATLRAAHLSRLSVHPESVLHRYLQGTPIDTVTGPDAPPLYPFHTNLSQRAAVANALQYPISVIDGPPGTGKTQTILNLVATLVADESLTVAVVSTNNTAVDNVHAKLMAAGFGFFTANLGRRAKREQFLADQDRRNTEVRELLGRPPVAVPSAAEMVQRDHRLLRLREIERELAELRAERTAYRLEQTHFEGYLARHELPDDEYLPVLRWSSDKILGFIADTDPELARSQGLGSVIDRITNYFKYRSLRFADADDVDLVLQLHQRFYRAKLAELDQQITTTEDLLQGKGFEAAAEEQRQASEAWLVESLRRRYTGRRPPRYGNNYTERWAQFSRDYPLILSTCHSLQSSIGRGRLVDYLVIDEASQVDLLAAAVALACCRNVIVGGDLRQLAPVDNNIDPALCGPAPSAPYDYHSHSILSSLTAVYGMGLPRTMLREHYRCDPAIIGFCNQKFYEDDLIPFTRNNPGFPSMVVARTVAGNHMRQLRNGGGRFNQREIDVIRQEVLPQFCAEFEHDEIGITTPYRKQSGRVAELIADIEADTVHSFQGREKDAIVMTTVLDEKKSSQGGVGGLEFADDPRLVNVAVSRAKKRFVLVTNNDLLPKSRNLRDLIGYIRYQNPGDEVFDSKVVSVFDLLYKQYSKKLDKLATRVARSPGHKSERIMRAVLGQMLPAEFPGLSFAEQVPLKHLLPDTDSLSDEQLQFARNRHSSVDFEIYNRVTKQRVCVIEVDGFEFHENNRNQQRRDALKDAICALYGIALLRFRTTDSGEPERLRRELAELLARFGEAR